MRTREAFLSVALAVALPMSLTACSSDDDGDDAAPNPSASVTEMTLECDEYADAAKAITRAQGQLYSAPGSEGAIDRLAGELDALKADAPPQIRAALTDMEAGFRDAEKFLANPTPENNASLVDLAPKLSADGQKITAYITSQCE